MYLFKWKSGLTFSLRFQVFLHYLFDFAHAETELTQNFMSKWSAASEYTLWFGWNEILYEWSIFLVAKW